MLAFVFPGQGALRPGQASPWRATPSWRVVEAISAAADIDVGTLLLDADGDTLTSTANAQIATFALSLVAHDHAVQLGLAAGVVAGHSLGEYTALVAAGALDLTDAVALVKARGAAMLAAATRQPGTMAAVLGASLAAVQEACTEAGETWVANDNAPGQVAIAGTAAGIARCEPLARAAGASRVVPLNVGGAFHSPLMAAAQPALDAALAGARWRSPLRPLVANVDATTHDDAAGWADLLSAQLCRPVRWREAQSTLQELGVDALVELGPGDTLCGLAKRTIPEVTRWPGSTPELVERAASR